MTTMRRQDKIPTQPDRTYSINEVCDLTGLSRRTIYNHRNAGKLIATYPTGRPKFTGTELARWIESWPVDPPRRDS